MGVDNVAQAKQCHINDQSQTLFPQKTPLYISAHNFSFSSLPVSFLYDLSVNGLHYSKFTSLLNILTHCNLQ